MCTNTPTYLWQMSEREGERERWCACVCEGYWGAYTFESADVLVATAQNVPLLSVHVAQRNEQTLYSLQQTTMREEQCERATRTTPSRR